MKKIIFLFLLIAIPVFVFGQSTGKIISNRGSNSTLPVDTINCNSKINLNQTTASVTITIPNRTTSAACGSNVSSGVTMYISNVGSVSTTLSVSGSSSFTLAVNGLTILNWVGTKWTIVYVSPSGLGTFVKLAGDSMIGNLDMKTNNITGVTKIINNVSGDNIWFTPSNGTQINSNNDLSLNGFQHTNVNGSTIVIQPTNVLKLSGSTTSNFVTLTTSALSSARTVNFPNKSGTFAFTTDLTSYMPIASPNDTGIHSSASGPVGEYIPHRSTSINGPPWNNIRTYSIGGGSYSNPDSWSQITQDPTNTYLQSKTGSNNSSLIVSSGTPTITLTASGSGAYVGIKTSSYFAQLKNTNFSSDRVFQFPDSSGTIALLSNIPVVATITANNGLTKTGNNIALGGTALNSTTTIDFAGNSLKVVNGANNVVDFTNGLFYDNASHGVALNTASQTLNFPSTGFTAVNWSSSASGLQISNFGSALGSVFLKNSNLTAGRTFQFPDKSGTLALTALPYALNPTSVKTSNYTAVARDFVVCDNTSGAFTVTLPTAPTDSTRIGVKLVTQGGTNTITIATGGSDVFNTSSGSTTLTLTLANQTYNLQYKASGGIWYVISGDFSLSSLDSRYLNQNTTGSAGTLSPGRNINGTLFDGSTNITITAVPSGTAGGVLSGTYPNPGVASQTGTGSTFAMQSMPVFTNYVTSPNYKVLNTGIGYYLYNTADTTTNVEVLRIDKAANVFRLSAIATGTGAARPITIQGAGRTLSLGSFTGPDGFFNFNSATGSNTANTSGIGISGALSQSSAIFNCISIVPTISQTSTGGYRGLWVSPFENTTGSGSKLLIDAGTNTAADGGGTHTTRFSVDNTGAIIGVSLALTGNMNFSGATRSIGTIDANDFNINTNNTNRLTIRSDGRQISLQSALGGTSTFLSYTQAAHSGGTQTGLLYTAGALTSQTTATEITDINYNLSAVLKSIDGTIPTNRSFIIQGRTLTPQTTALTVTKAITMEVNPPIAGSGTTFTNPAMAISSNGNIALSTVGNKFFIKEGSGGSMGQTTLVSGTKAITVAGVTSSTRCFLQLVAPSGVALTIESQCACTTNTVTIQANVAAGTINTNDNSTYNYILYEPAP